MFTPQLVKTYDALKAKDAEFEIIFVSRDKTEEDFKVRMLFSLPNEP